MLSITKRDKFIRKLQEKIVTRDAEIYINEDEILKDDDQDMSTARTPEFLLAQFFTGVRKLCCSIFSFLCIRNFLSAIKYLSFCFVLPVYLYHILLLK
jgi:hypothetical protein